MKNNVKILVDCHVFDGKSQGTTTYLKGLYTEFLNTKNVTLFLVAFNPEILKKEFGESENVIFLKYPSKNKFKRLLFDIPLLIKKHKIDFAHFQYIVPPIKTCKFVVTIHDVLFMDFPKFFPLSYRIKNYILFYLSGKKSDYVLTVSNYSKEKIQKYFNLKNIYLTPNAVDKTFFEHYNKPLIQSNVKKKFNIQNYFLFVSRREPRKNHLNLLKAFVYNNHFKKYELVFIGNNDIKDNAFDVYYNSLPIEVKDKIFFLENINFEDLVSITRAATMAIYPSFAEGFGIPPLESIAAEIPTICSNTTAMSDFSFMAGFMFNPYSIEDINNKIEIALASSKTNTLKEKIKGIYSWTISAKVLNTIFNAENNI